MTAGRSAVVKAAQGWIGTPYRHQASCKGAGADCLGLLRGVWREILGQEPEQPPAYTMDWSEPQGEERLWKAAMRHLTPTAADNEIGQILLFRMRPECVAKHLGLLTEVGQGGKFIHAYSGHGVVESALTEAWRRRLVARFDFPLEGS